MTGVPAKQGTDQEIKSRLCYTWPLFVSVEIVIVSWVLYIVVVVATVAVELVVEVVVVVLVVVLVVVAIRQIVRWVRSCEMLIGQLVMLTTPL